MNWSSLEKAQPIASKILMNSIKKDRLAHAYLIQGLRGTGKTEIATLLTQTIFCPEKKDLEPCGTCHVCKRVSSRNHPDVHWIEKDGQSIKNEQIDYLRKEFSYSSLESTRKIYIIEDAQAMTNQAANRLLKFLEEPLIETMAILLTDNIQGMIPTIRSRCQIIDLKPLDTNLLQKEMMNADLSKEQSKIMSAITYNIDEAIELTEDEKYQEIITLSKGMIKAIVTDYDNRFIYLHQNWLKEITDRKDTEYGLDLILLGFKDIAYMQIGKEESLVFFNSTDQILKDALQIFTKKRLLQIMNALLKTKQKLKQNVNPTLLMEQFVLQL
ncbi:MAG TPA: DNA polymerase III subunit delta' [Pseudogracilibacillus sp.]|nr:DNA polymerase III subunit delta' [Pseudogracilibacillus sp.]